MPRLTKPQTRRKLREAVIAEAVENGFRALSVGGVVQRARVSAGTVYVHFQDKEDMLQQVFLEIKDEFHTIMMSARQEPSPAAMVRRMWFDLFDFVAERPADFLFLELGNNAQFLTPDQQVVVGRQYEEIGETLMLGVKDGTLADLGARMLTLLLVAPAVQLAREGAMTGQPVPDQKVEQVFERVWRAIAADGVPAPQASG